MGKQVIVIGMGRFGVAVSRELFALGHEVLAIDRNADKLGAVVDYSTHTAQADGCNRAALEELGVRDLDVAIVAMSSNLEASILCAINVLDLGVPQVIARANSEIHATILEKLGVGKVVQAEQEAAATLAHTFAVPNAREYMPLGPNYGVAKLVAPASFVGRTVKELDLLRRYDLSLVALVRENAISLYPRTDERIKADDSLVLVGRDDRMEAIGK